MCGQKGFMNSFLVEKGQTEAATLQVFGGVDELHKPLAILLDSKRLPDHLWEP